MNKPPSVFHIDRLDLNFTPKPWAFAVEQRAGIEAFFAAQQRDNPALWNGPVLLMHRQTVSGGVFHGDFLQTDFASFSAWAARGKPETGVCNCFAAAAVLSADGAYLLGVMGPHTFNRGQIYFPCGTPDPSDIAGGQVDLDFSVRRELKEETGLDVAEFAAEPGWTAVAHHASFALIKVLRARERAATLRARILDELARDKQPELSGIYIARGVGDFVPAMPDYVTAFLADRFTRA